jgi:hypothetical protein
VVLEGLAIIALAIWRAGARSHACGGRFAPKWAKSKRVDLSSVHGHATKYQAMPAGKFPPGISRHNRAVDGPASTNSAKLAFLKSELALLIYLAEFAPQLPHGRWSPANWLLPNLVRKRHRGHCDSENAGGAVVSYRYLPALAAAGRSLSLFPRDGIGSRGLRCRSQR